ncbi:MAG: NAD-dependent epimerase/dehydratase family protein, partial [Sinomonas sp.]|nr:NAD-dependent epimerase/dehydratase family protein [Sinomonas sp.]
MTWQRTTSQWFRLPAARLWDVLERLERWPAWNPAVGAAAVIGQLREGAAGSYSPAHRILGPLHRRTAPSFRVTAVDPGRRIALHQPQPGGGQEIEWTLEERSGGTQFTQRVTLSGPLAQQFGLTAGEPLVRDFAGQCARLYRLAAPAEPAHDGGDTGPLTAIAGGSGYLGTILASNLLCDGHRVVALARALRPSPFEQLPWDGRTLGSWSDRLAAEPRVNVANLAGVSLDMPGTPENLAKLEATRVEPTRALVDASRSWNRPAERWLQQSAVGIYGDSPEAFDETSPVPDAPGLAAVVRAWEAAFDGAAAERHAILRPGVVLAREAAILER